MTPTPPAPDRAKRPPELGMVMKDTGGWVLRTADGQRLPAPGNGAPVRAWQAADGWILLRESGEIWLIRPDGASRLVARADGSYRVAELSPDGRRFAWKTGAAVKVGRLTKDGLVEERAAPMTVDPAKGKRAFGIVGWFGSRLVLAQWTTSQGGRSDPDLHDVWNPDREYKATWKPGIKAIYGPAGNDGFLIGATNGPSGQPCLRLIGADDLGLSRERCDLGPIAGDMFVSPTSRWVVSGRIDQPWVPIPTGNTLDAPPGMAHPTAYTGAMDSVAWETETELLVLFRGTLHRLNCYDGTTTLLESPAAEKSVLIEKRGR